MKGICLPTCQTAGRPDPVPRGHGAVRGSPDSKPGPQGYQNTHFPNVLLQGQLDTWSPRTRPAPEWLDACPQCPGGNPGLCPAVLLLPRVMIVRSPGAGAGSNLWREAPHAPSPEPRALAGNPALPLRVPV